MFVETRVKTVSLAADTLELFSALTDKGKDVLLFESRDSCGESGLKSLLFVGNALRIEGRGDEVTLTSLSSGGRDALRALLPELENLGEVKSDNEKTVIRIATGARTGSDIDRVKTASTLDVLRLISMGWVETGGGGAPVRVPGVFAYDLVEQYESLPEARADGHGFPDFVFWLPARVVVLNHMTEEAEFVEYLYGVPSQAGAGSWIPDLEKLESHGVPSQAGAGSWRGDLDVHVDMGDDEYAALVERVKEHIRAGDVFQIVPSRTFSMACPDPLAAFDALRRSNPSPYMFYLNWEGFTLFGSSPEACVRVSGTPLSVQIHPIAGTRPRGKTEEGEIDVELDTRFEAELRLNEKELAEHMMLVDLARNDVARINRPGTRRVASLTEVERYSHVMHLVSVVEGELREDLDALHAYAASANMGTLVGAPKIEAARLLRRYEADRRGPYGGAVGYLTSEGELDTAIVIRSALVRDGVAYIRAGAGVVFDSDPAAEADETRNKANAVLEAIRIAAEVAR
ncbi:MAG: anthranilate synthase component 1 [Deltaproteobacteria bacterium]|nr:anthranilate synthase component 1 [Deltaproteobacteria bacterium]